MDKLGLDLKGHLKFVEKKSYGQSGLGLKPPHMPLPFGRAMRGCGSDPNINFFEFLRENYLNF